MFIPDQVLRVNSQPSDSKAPRLHKKSLINSSGLFLAANRKPLRVSAVCNTRKGRGAGGGGDWIPQRSPLKRNPRAARSLYPSRSYDLQCMKPIIIHKASPSCKRESCWETLYFQNAQVGPNGPKSKTAIETHLVVQKALVGSWKWSKNGTLGI